MGKPHFLLAALTLISCTVHVVADEPSDLNGSWTLRHYEVNGKKSEWNSWELYGIYKEGAKWNLDGDGSGNCGGTICKWSYDSRKQKFNLSTKNYLGFWVTSIADADTAIMDGELYISCKQFGQSMKFLLKPDKAMPVEIEDSGTTLSLDDEIVDREVFSELIETVPGLPKKLTVRREYETTINSTVTAGTEIEGGVKLGPKIVASLSAELRAKLEIEIGMTLGRRDEVTETYELDGKKIVKVRVTWIERYRRGTLTLKDGTTKKFLVCVGLRTVPELVD